MNKNVNIKEAKMDKAVMMGMISVISFLVGSLLVVLIAL